MSSHRDISGVRQVHLKPDVLRVHIETGGQLPSSGIAWRVTANNNSAGKILPLLETYLLSEHGLPDNFVSKVAHVSSEALINAGKYSRPESEIQASCFVVGIGDHRQCDIVIFNYTLPNAEPFPEKEKIPTPDKDVHLLKRGGMGLPIMKARTDHFVLEDLPGNAKLVTLTFKLASHIE